MLDRPIVDLFLNSLDQLSYRTIRYLVRSVRLFAIFSSIFEQFVTSLIIEINKPILLYLMVECKYMLYTPEECLTMTGKV